MSSTRRTPEFHEEFDKFFVKFRQDLAANRGGYISSKNSFNHTAFLKEARTPGMMSLLNLVRCIMLNRSLEAKKHVIKHHKLIGEYIKSCMDYVFESDMRFNTKLQKALYESILIEDEILELLPPDKAHLMSRYDENTNGICDNLREEAFLYAICLGVHMESVFPGFVYKES